MAGWWWRRRWCASLAALAVAVVASMAACARADARAPGVQAQLDEFDAAVRHADGDAAAAHGRADVVDLGASLRIVEERFAGLRAALMAEMGAKGAPNSASVDAANKAAAKLHDHARDISTQGADMVQKLAQSRAEVHAVLAEVRVVDDATAELKTAITKLEKEISDLGQTLRQAQVDSNVLTSAHNDLRNSVRDVHARSQQFPDVREHVKSLVPKWYYFVLAEFLALLSFAAFKVYKMKRRDKFSKLG